MARAVPGWLSPAAICRDSRIGAAPGDRKPTGLKLYGVHCGGCHGADGTLGPGPPLNDPLLVAIMPHDELLQVITSGRPGTPMPGFAHRWVVR